MTKQRIDILMVERGLAESRSLAQRLVMAGEVRVNGQVELKASAKVDESSEIVVAQGPQFVSRGGEKLLGALEAFNLLDLSGLICADIGSSTGGFTDCMLQHGAAYAFESITLKLSIRLPTITAQRLQQTHHGNLLQIFPGKGC